ncbi:uncharacterized protein LOC144913297 [Branchiostoma floridae x Branchiostoma belcheri]
MTTAFPYPPRHVVHTSRVPASRIPAPADNMKKQDAQQRLVGNTRSRLEVLQQQYQQKLLREREAKMIEIYEKNQQAALQKVNRQTSLRDFFKERRSLEATKGGAVPSIQHHYKNKVKQQNQFAYKSKQPVWNPTRTRRGPEAERKPWSGINRGNPLQPIQRQAISADDRYRQPDPDGHYETSDDLTSNHSSNPPSDLEDEDVEFKFVPKPPVQQRPGKVRQTRRAVKQDSSRKDVKQFSPEDDGYYSNQQEDSGYSGNPARESDDQPPTNFAKAKLLGKIKQKERDRIASREGTFHSDYGEKESAGDKDQPNEGERKNKRDVLKQQEEELMALLRQRQEELEKLKRENEEAERQEEERKRKEAQRRKRLHEERQRREEELRRLEEEEQKAQEEEENDEQNSSRHDEDEDDWYQNKEKEDEENSLYQNKEKEDDEDSWFQDKEKEEQNFNATYTMKQKEKQVRHEKPKKEHHLPIPDNQKEAKPNEDLAFYIEAAEGSEEVPLNLTPCPNCGRKFAVERLAKHQKACSSMKKRKVMDPTKMRTQGTEMEKYSDPRDKRPEPSSKKADWRKKREDFIQAIRYAKKVAEVEKNGGNVADLPPPPRSENPDYKQCPYCQRKFNETAAERHIPKCKEIKSRPPPMKRR